jgi:hypothetical protein
MSSQSHIIDRMIIERLIVSDAPSVVGAAPERVADLHKIWQKYDPEFVRVPDSLGVTLISDIKQIKFDTKIRRIIWMAGHAAWRIFVCHSPHLLVSLANRSSVDSVMLHEDNGFQDARTEFEGLLYVIRGLVEAETSEQVDRPKYISKPQADITGFTVEQKATFDLPMIAMAYAFLHEIRHVMFFGVNPKNWTV